MKKTYRKPEVCCMNSRTGKILSTSSSFSERAVRLMSLRENERESMEEFTSERKIQGES